MNFPVKNVAQPQRTLPGIDKAAVPKLYFLASVILAWPVFSTSSPADMLAIQAGRILPIASDEITDGVILIEDGKIKALGPDVVIPQDAKILDAKDKVVMPGMIDLQSRLYLMDSELHQPSGAPEHNILDALDAFNDEYEEVLAQGVTTVCVVPTNSSLLAGRCAALRLNGAKTIDKMLLKSDVAVKASIGLAQNNRSSSLTRLDHYASLRETFIAAKEYLKRRDKYEYQLAEYKKKMAELKEKEKDKDKPQAKSSAPPPKRPAKLSVNPTYEILTKVLRKEIPLRIETHRVDDILHALRLAEEFKFSLILDNCTEGYRIADQIAKHKVPVIVGPVTTSFFGRDSLEYRNHNQANASILARQGIQLAIGTSTRDGVGSKFLSTVAAIAVSQGLERNQALQAVTLTAARILGVDDRIGSLDVGKDADIVILSGQPLSSMTQVEMVLIQGKTVYNRKVTK